MDIESLNIQINANADKADNAIDKLSSSLSKLSSALGKFSSSSKSFDKVSSGLNNATSTINKLGNAISGLDSSKLTAAASAIKTVSNATGNLATNLQKFSNENSDFSKLAEGLSNCIAVIKRLGNAINGLDGTKLHDLATAMNEVASAGKKMSQSLGAKGISGPVQSVTDNISGSRSRRNAGTSGVDGESGGRGSWAEETAYWKEKAKPYEEANKAFKAREKYFKAKDEYNQNYNPNQIEGKGSVISDEEIKRMQRLANQYDSLSKKAAQLKKSLVSQGLGGASKAFSTLGDAGLKVAHGIDKAFIGVANGLKGLGKVTLDYAKHKLEPVTNTFGRIRDGFSNLGAAWSGFLGRVAKTGVFMLVRKAFTAMIDSMKEQIDSLAIHSDKIGSAFNKQMSSLQAGFTGLSANLASAFEGLLNIVYPVLEAIIKAVTAVIQVISQLFAALGGKATFSVPTVSMGNFAKTTDQYANSAKKANKNAKELKRTLMGFDELNRLEDKDKDSSPSAADIKGANAPQVKWSEKSINPTIKKIADKLKEWWDRFLAPLKKAWDAMLPYLKAGWAYMCKELAALLCDVIDTFLDVWNEEATVEMLKNILGIVGDLMFVVGNLAHNIKEAWDYNENGKKILENIRDQLAIIVQHVRNVTKYMKGWSKSLDFKPLFTSLVKLTDACKKLADFVGQAFEDFMIDLVLPYLKYLIEVGLPKLNDTIADVINKIPWHKLNTQLDGFFISVENLLERISEATIDLIGRLGDDIADFFNSPLWDQWADAVQKFIDNIPVEDIFDILGDIAEGIGKVVENVMKFTTGDTFIEFLNKLKDWIHKIGDSDVIQHLFDVISQAILILADRLLKFIDSPAFQGFLDWLFDICKNLKAEDVANFLQGLAFAIAGFKFTAFAADKLSGLFKFLEWCKGIAQYKSIMSTLKDISNALGKGAGVAGAADEAGQAFTQMSGDFGTAAADILDEEGNVVGQTTVNMSDVQGGFASMFGSFVQTVQSSGLREALIGTIGEVGTNALGIGNIIGGLVGGVLSFVSQWQNGGSVIKGVIQIISGALVGLGLVIMGVAGWPAILVGAAVAAAAEIVIVIKDHWNEIQEFLAPVGDFFQGIWDGIKEGASVAWDGITGVISGAWDVISSGASAAWEGITGVLTSAWQNISTVVGPYFQTIGGIISDVWSGISDVASTMWTVISGFLEGAWQRIVEFGSSIWNGLVQIFSAVWGLISAVAQGVWQTFTTWIEGVWQGIVDKAKEIWNGLVEFFTNIWNNIVQLGQKIWSVLGPFFEKLWNGIKSVATTVWNAVSTYLSGVWNRLKGIASTVFTAIGGVIKTAWEAVTIATQTIWNNLKDWVSEKWNTIKSNLLSVDWKEVGYHLVNGLLGGIQEKWEGLVSWVTDGVNALTQKVKDLFGIHSPSTVFYDIGSYLVQGMDNGLVENWEQLPQFFSDSITNLITTIQTTLQTGVETITGYITTALATIQTVLTTAWTTIQEAATTVWTGIQTTLTTVWATISESATTIWTTIQTTITTIWNALSETATTVWTIIQTTFTTVTTTIQTTITTIWTAIQEFLQTTWTTIQTFGTTTWTAIQTSITTIATTIQTTLNTVFTTISTFIQTTWNTVKTFTQTTWDNIKTKITTNVDNIFNKIKTGFTNAQNTTRTVFQNMYNNISNMMQNAYNKVHSMIERIKAAFNVHLSFPHIPLPHLSVSGRFSINPPSVPSFSIAWYKNGGFLEDGLFTMNKGEIAGKFKDGKSVVANNEQIIEGIKQGVTEAMTNVLMNISSGNNQQQSGSDDRDIVIQIDGREVYRAVVKENNRQVMRTGASPLRV